MHLIPDRTSETQAVIKLVFMLSDRIVVSNKTFKQFERLNRLSEHPLKDISYTMYVFHVPHVAIMHME